MGTEYGASAAPAKAKQLTQMPGSLPHFASAILLLYGVNQSLAKVTATLGIRFPSALIGTALGTLVPLLPSSWCYFTSSFFRSHL